MSVFAAVKSKIQLCSGIFSSPARVEAFLKKFGSKYLFRQNPGPPGSNLSSIYVCECPENEFPESFKESSSHSHSSDNIVCQEEKPEATVDCTIDTKAFLGWIVEDKLWTNDDETCTDEMTYVNLQLNPEGYTGYTGPSARRIWDAIYIENCPKYPFGECQEKRILYKLISGLHPSILIHIAADHLQLEPQSCSTL
ncbi:unnamed protein product [Fraxinus pennsylvanica]|uniref:Uncharacterized protein n=1 Tax=Fraxinus pennsylvanica TaxID=56036 RepID=A0AAD1YLZ2_9LAMI|nr:unnamed protein product [Fraxinus pennsylvanica]